MTERRLFNIIQENLCFKSSKDSSRDFQDIEIVILAAKKKKKAIRHWVHLEAPPTGSPRRSCCGDLVKLVGINKIVDLNLESTNFWALPPNVMCCSLLAAPSNTGGKTLASIGQF